MYLKAKGKGKKNPEEKEMKASMRMSSSKIFIWRWATEKCCYQHFVLWYFLMRRIWMPFEWNFVVTTSSQHISTYKLNWYGSCAVLIFSMKPVALWLIILVFFLCNFIVYDNECILGVSVWNNSNDWERDTVSAVVVVMMLEMFLAI